MSRRRRNYKAMTDENLFIAYWELRNGLKRAGTPRITEGDIHWNSSYGYEAYDRCLATGSDTPWVDCLYCENIAHERGLDLCWRGGKKNFSEQKHVEEEEKIVNLEPDVIEI